MSTVTRIPGSAPSLNLPLPAGTSSADVSSLIGELECLMERAERLIVDLRTRMQADVAQLPDGFDPEEVADGWFESHAEPLLLDHPFISESYGDEISIFQEGCTVVASVLADWQPLAERMSALLSRHVALNATLERAFADVAYAEAERRG